MENLTVHRDPPVKQSQNFVLIVFYACVLSDRVQAISLTQADEHIDSLEFPFHPICLRTVGGNQSTQRKPTQTQYMQHIPCVYQLKNQEKSHDVIKLFLFSLTLELCDLLLLNKLNSASAYSTSVSAIMCSVIKSLLCEHRQKEGVNRPQEDVQKCTPTYPFL